ncbi:MAG: UvrB/UvrC motif-containing protein [Bacillota bacterium]|nr:UvrB/UvrC motif-containing protein [Bacillota bacterium]
MLCERCKERPATFFLTRIVNGEKTELHLCQQCAAETGQLGIVLEPQFTFTNFLAGLLNNELGFAPAKQSPSAPQCRNCGLTYDDFRQVGQFACSHCYEEFEPYLEGLFRRVQGGTEHVGKSPGQGRPRPRPAKPARAVAAPASKPRLEQLREELAAAIAREEYERAAELRDEIRRLEKEGQSHGE